MNGMNYRISIEVLENAFEVTVPDAEAMKKSMAEKRKVKGQESSVPYAGDFEKKFAAKNVAEVTKLIKAALEGLPEVSFNEAFAEASKAA